MTYLIGGDLPMMHTLPSEREVLNSPIGLGLQQSVAQLETPPEEWKRCARRLTFADHTTLFPVRHPQTTEESALLRLEGQYVEVYRRGPMFLIVPGNCDGQPFEQVFVEPLTLGATWSEEWLRYAVASTAWPIRSPIILLAPPSKTTPWRLSGRAWRLFADGKYTSAVGQLYEEMQSLLSHYCQRHNLPHFETRFDVRGWGFGATIALEIAALMPPKAVGSVVIGGPPNVAVRSAEELSAEMELEQPSSAKRHLRWTTWQVQQSRLLQGIGRDTLLVQVQNLRNGEWSSLLHKLVVVKGLRDTVCPQTPSFNAVVSWLLSEVNSRSILDDMWSPVLVVNTDQTFGRQLPWALWAAWRHGLCAPTLVENPHY